MACLLKLDNDVLLLILRKALAADQDVLGDLLLVCKHIRNALLAAATSVFITTDHPALLRHCRALRSVTLDGCDRLPWELDASDGSPRIAPSHLSHLSSITHIDAEHALLPLEEMAKLRCLPKLTHLRASKALRPSELPQLDAITSLRSLDLSPCPHLSADIMVHLSHLTALESLDVHGSTMPADECLAHVTGLTALTQLLFRPRRSPGAAQNVTDAGLACLARLTALRSLDLRGLLSSQAPQLSHLSALRHLEALDLSRINTLSHDDLAFLRHLTVLHTLNLEHCAGIDFNRGLAHVSALNRLSQLDFHDRGLRDEGVAHLTRLTAITALDLTGCWGMRTAGFACLRRMSCLRKLLLRDGTAFSIAEVVANVTGLTALHEVSVEGMSNRGLSELCSLSSLTTLKLTRFQTPQGLEPISKLRALQHLDMSAVVLWNVFDINAALMHISGLTALTALEFGGGFVPGMSDEAIAHLSALRNLRSLELKGCKMLTHRGLASLSALGGLSRLLVSDCTRITHLVLPPYLTHVDLSGCLSIENDSFVALRRLPALASFSLHKCTQLSDAGLMHLCNLTALTELDLRGCKALADGGLQQLSRLRALKTLRLRGCELLGGGALAALGCLHALTFLDLARCTRASDADLAHLARLPRLRQLHLCSVPLTSEGLAHIARITSLTYLNLRDCPRVDDAALAQLTSLVRLRCLFVGGSVTPAGFAPLQALRHLKLTSRI